MAGSLALDPLDLCLTGRDLHLLLQANSAQARCLAGLCDGCPGSLEVVDLEASLQGRHVVTRLALCPRGEEAALEGRRARSGLPATWTPSGVDLGARLAVAPFLVVGAQEPISREALWDVVAQAVEGYRVEGRYVYVPAFWELRDLDRERVWTDLSGAGVVALDGWDLGKPVDWFLDVLVEVVDNRRRAGAPTILRVRRPPVGRTKAEAAALADWVRG